MGGFWKSIDFGGKRRSVVSWINIFRTIYTYTYIYLYILLDVVYIFTFCGILDMDMKCGQNCGYLSSQQDILFRYFLQKVRSGAEQRLSSIII